MQTKKKFCTTWDILELMVYRGSFKEIKEEYKKIPQNISYNIGKASQKEAIEIWAEI